MNPPNNSDKPRQFLRPGPPFPAQGQPAASSPLFDPAQSRETVSGYQATGQAEQGHGPNFPAAPMDEQPWLFSGVAGADEQPWLFSSTNAQQVPPGVSPATNKVSSQFQPFAAETQEGSQFQPFAPGKHTGSQFQPFATSKHTSSQFQSFTGKVNTPAYPDTGRQHTPPTDPFDTGRQEANNFLLYPPGQPRPASPAPFLGTGPVSSIQPAQDGSGQAPGYPTTGRQQIPPFGNERASQQFAAFQPGSFTASSVPSMGAIQAFPQMPPTTASSVPSMGAIPAAPYASSARIPAATGPRSAAVPAAQSSKMPKMQMRDSVKVAVPDHKISRNRKVSVITAIVCLVLIFSVVLVSQRDWVLSHTHSLTGTQGNTTAQSGPTMPSLNSYTNNKEISPFLFGTNMGLFHDNDEGILNSAATQQQLRNIGVRIIRMPYRMTLKPQTEIAAAQAIKNIGASALVVMHGPEFKDAPLYDSDSDIVSAITGVFGNQPVYFEFGNESDLANVTADQYVTKWNQVIPLLKKQYPTARFIGPDNYQFTRRYLKTFLQQAKPLPDGISWHEYTCSVTWSAQFCLSNIDTWPIHFAQARAVMQETIGKEIPLWVSEWNYTSDQAIINGKPISDGKYTDMNFMQQWTTKAMQTLIDNRIYASMQYYALDEPMPLVYKDQVGVEGKIFQQNYKSIMVDGKTPTANYYKVPAPVQDPNAQYSFEAGTQGWMAIGDSTQPISTTAKALDGSHSLMVTLPDASEDTFPYVAIPGSMIASPPKAGQMISAYLYVANPKALVNAKIFVADPTHAWHFANSVTLTPGAWNKIWYSLPLNFNMQVSQVGIQFFTSTPGASTDLYLDGFEWK